MKTPIAVILFFAVTLSMGCAFKHAPTFEEQATAESSGLYGPYPENCEEAVKKYLNMALFDPYSVQDLQIGKPEKGFLFARGGWFAEDACCYGWTVPVGFNAKNRMGGYIGFQSANYFIKDGVCYGDVVPRETVRMLGSRRYN